MLLKAKIFCKKIFQYFGTTELKIIGSSGLYLIKDFMNESGIVEIFNREIYDNRDQLRIIYRAPEILLSSILRILNGEQRISHCESASKSFFEEMYSSRTVPDFRTLIYYFNSNPETAHQLRTILNEISLKYLREKINELKLTRLTLDIDQTARAIHGLQEGARKGYSSKDKNSKLFQVAVWSIRETKTVINLELLTGEKHCANNFLNRLVAVLENLKTLGVKIRVICDSGYENIDVFEYLETEKIEFLFAVKQRNNVKMRGRNAKKKELGIENGRVMTIFKERVFKTENTFIFRQIFIQNKISIDKFGQRYFKNFESNEFTNVFITNMKISKKNIYKEYKKHAIIETIIEELKNDFKLAVSHSKYFEFNMALAGLVTIAYNIKNMFISKIGILQKKNEIVKLSTLQRNFIHLPGILVNHGGKRILKVERHIFDIFHSYFSRFGYKLILKS